MRYFICGERKGKLNILSVYNSQEEAFKRLKFFIKKEMCALKIVPLPKICVGCKIYHNNGIYYGTVVYETNVLWGVSEVEKVGSIPNPYVKQRMDQLIITRGLMVVDGNEFKEVTDIMKVISELDTIVKGLLKSFEYVNAEQIAFF